MQRSLQSPIVRYDRLGLLILPMLKIKFAKSAYLRYNSLTVFIYARVAKLVDALALGASEATHEGSSPFPGTSIQNTDFLSLYFVLTVCL